MTLWEIIASVGTFLSGLAAIIQALKPQPKKKRKKR